MDYMINTEYREIRKEEYPLLKDFLYEAVYQPDPKHLLPRDIVNTPDLQIYISDFGNKSGDLCECVTVNNTIVGAAWVRYINGYGNVSGKLPELAISILSEYRGKGLGSKLLNELLERLKEKKYPGASLSVQKDNYAYKMYLKAGFKIVTETDEEYLMTICY